MSNKEISFETALSQLEEIVKALEGGEKSLDESMELYEKGIALSKQCATALEGARQKIISLTDAESEDGEDA